MHKFPVLFAPLFECNQNRLKGLSKGRDFILYFWRNLREYSADRIVREVIDAVRSEWQGPLFLRISSTEYHDGGNTPQDYLIYGRWTKEQRVDLIDCSSGGIAMVKVDSYPGYQVPAAELLRRELGILTGAVGLIENGTQAEEIVRNNRADFVFVGREMLKDPFWARTAADALSTPIDVPPQYTRYGSTWQRSQPALPAAPLTQR